MKKIVSFKKVIFIVALVILLASSRVFATDSILATNDTTDNSASTPITLDDYSNAQTVPTDNNATATNDTLDTNTANNNTISNGLNTNSAYNTVDEDKTDLPQTGIEDYNVGILLVICIGAAIYTYKKMKDYKNV